MAVVAMKKFTLVALAKDKQALYDGMVKTGCVQLTESQPIEQCFTTTSEAEVSRLPER